MFLLSQDVTVLNDKPAAENAHGAFDAWDMLPTEGQLVVDVWQSETNVLAISPMAGAAAATIEVYVHNDLLTIRASRQPSISLDHYTALHTECFWGSFSRTVVLPVPVVGERARASFQNGVLTVLIPKRPTTAKIPIVIVDE